MEALDFVMDEKFSVFSVQFWLRPVWSPRRPIYAALRYQLVALATYLPKGYLVTAATYLPRGYLTKLRFRLRYGISWSRQRPIFASLRFADSVALTQVAIAK
jgi:hypothetical protein